MNKTNNDGLTDEEHKELVKLQNYFELCSLGARPHAPSAEEIRRLIELEGRQRSFRLSRLTENYYSRGNLK